jgi:arylsulfatase A-like enzyme
MSRALAPDTAGKPTVVFILLDSVRLDHVGWGGSELDTTPRLDALARDGVAFTQDITQAPWTKPSVGSLMTGQAPSFHKATTRFGILEPRSRSIGEAFASGGYRTLALSSNPNITPTFGFAPGFQSFHHDVTDSAETLIGKGLEWLDSAPQQASFLYLHLNDAHYPYDPLPGYAGMFNQTGVEAHLDGDVEREFRDSQGTTMTAEEVESLRLSYAEEIRYLDDQVGGLVEGLIAARDDVLVVIVSDHGEEFLDHGDLGHAHTLYEELIRVPMQFSWSPALGERMGWSAGVFDQQVRNVDILPTLLEVAGLEWPAHAQDLQGTSLTPFFSGSEAIASRPAFSETDFPGTPLSGPSGPLRSFRSDGYKMIRTASWLEQTSGRGWLFQLAADPAERRNIAADNLDLFQQMNRRMSDDGWILVRDIHGGASAEVSEALRAEMAELGYAGDDFEAPDGEFLYLDPKAVPWIEIPD